ncbi:MAG: M23 family metallopeptidase [Cyanophyceae cyanobacterium]
MGIRWQTWMGLVMGICGILCISLLIPSPGFSSRLEASFEDAIPSQQLSPNLSPDLSTEWGTPDLLFHGPFKVLPEVGIPLLQQPFAGQVVTNHWFDHDPGRADFLTLKGDRFQPDPQHPCAKQSGHRGYDWPLAAASPVLAAATGRVTVARPEPSFFCPSLGREVQGLRVRLQHDYQSPDQPMQRYETLYAHLSQIQVQEGAQIAAGTVIGLAGDTGCATGSHLHFEVRRLGSVPLDPYGWWGEGADPWTGSPSFSLWKAGQAPPLVGC